MSKWINYTLNGFGIGVTSGSFMSATNATPWEVGAFIFGIVTIAHVANSGDSHE